MTRLNLVQGTRVFQDPTKGEHMLSSAFERNNQLVQSLQLDPLPRLEGPLWWLAAENDGQMVLHATLSDPSALVPFHSASYFNITVLLPTTVVPVDT